MMSLTFGLFTQVSGSGPLGPLVYFLIVGIPILKIVLPYAHKWVTSDVIL